MQRRVQLETPFSDGFAGFFADIEHRYGRGWRLFNDNDVETMKAEVNRKKHGSTGSEYSFSYN